MQNGFAMDLWIPKVRATYGHVHPVQETQRPKNAYTAVDD